MRSMRLLALAAVFLASGILLADTPKAVSTQIKANVAFLVPLTDGSAATARCEVVNGLARLTIASSGGFTDLQLLPWGDVPPVPPVPPIPPTPPTPPLPPVPPTPPTPPQPTSLRALFLYESADLTAMPPAKAAILTSPKIRAWLKAKCPLETGCIGNACPQLTAKTASFRFFDKDIDRTKLTPAWQQTMGLADDPKRVVPWVVLVDQAGNIVLDQAWPDSEAAMLAALKKAGGE